MFDTAGRTADYPIAEVFLNRHSPRAFTDAPVTEEQMLSLFEAARWAPSTSNTQPWRFAYALRGDAAFDALFDGLVPFNQMWAGKAAALVVVASATTTTDAEGGTQDLPNHAFDTGAAWGYLALQAHMDGLVAHAMGGFDYDAIAKAVALPAGLCIRTVVAVGYHGDIDRLNERMHKGETPNARNPISETVVRGSF